MSQYLADIKETEFFIMDEEAHHVCTVARCKEGEEITVFNGKGLQYTGRIERIQKNFVRGSLLKKVPLRRPAVELELFFAPNSRTGLEEVLDKGTQLGVAAFCPIVTARTEYDVLKRWEDKFPRWRQIMLSACKQCNTPLFADIAPGTLGSREANTIYNHIPRITSGCTASPLNYCPQAYITREQMAPFIIRAKEGNPTTDLCAAGSPLYASR